MTLIDWLLVAALIAVMIAAGQWVNCKLIHRALSKIVATQQDHSQRLDGLEGWRSKTIERMDSLIQHVAALRSTIQADREIGEDNAVLLRIVAKNLGVAEADMPAERKRSSIPREL